jgi:hypothetical protein
MRHFVSSILFGVVVAGVLGCSNSPEAPKPLSPEEQKQESDKMKEQLRNERQSGPSS